MSSIVSKLMGGKGAPKNPEGIIEVNKELSVKTLLPQEFGLVDLDLLETVGTGTFGRIRLVKTLSSKQFYALKVMKKGRIVELRQLPHIQDEVKVMSRVRCSFIPELVAFFQDDNNIYMLMEYVEGGELFSHLRRQGKFSFVEYQFFAVELACAIHYLHELDVAYRDLKPENVLLTKDGHIRLVDFGLAKFLKEDKTFTLCGTPEYLAPETIQGQGHGKGVDWWALGVLIYEMAYGYPPFYADNPFGVYQKILHAKIEFPGAPAITTRSVVKGFCTVSRGSRLGCKRGGFDSIAKHSFYSGIEWMSAARQLLMPPLVPLVLGEGDTSNYDLYPDEGVDEIANFTIEERKMFGEFDIILDRI